MGDLLRSFALLFILPLIFVALVIAVVLGLGWLLTQILPFSLFEASVIVALVGIPVIWLFGRFLSSAIELGERDEEPGEDEGFWIASVTRAGSKIYSREKKRRRKK